MYPQSYYDYGTFAYKITVGSRKRILLTFKEFYVESYSDECYSATFTVGMYINFVLALSVLF